MGVRILGMNNFESADHAMTSIVVDESIALDAGSLTRSLTTEQQGRIRFIFLTHRHFDHVRDAVDLVFKAGLDGRPGTRHIYGLQDVIDALSEHVLGELRPKLQEREAADGLPLLELHVIEPGSEISVDGHGVAPLPAFHGVPAVGYRVTLGDRSLYYTGDTGPGFAAALEQSPPGMLLTEVTFSDSEADRASRSNHMTPATLRSELEQLVHAAGWEPRVVAVHVFPGSEPEVRREIDRLRLETGWDITVGSAGAVLDV